MSYTHLDIVKTIDISPLLFFSNILKYKNQYNSLLMING